MSAGLGGGELRLLILTPVGRDAALTADVIGQAGVECIACSDLEQTARECEAGVGALLVAEEAMANGEGSSLVEIVASQPPWSDLPVLVLTRTGTDSSTVAEALQSLRNVTLLERPTRMAALVSTVQSALRARRRQYQLRDQVDALERSERDLSDFFENASIGLHWVSSDGTILRANKAELEMLGYARDEYVGRNVREVHVDSEAIDDTLRQMLAGETVENYEARLRRKDGSVRDVVINSNGLWENGQLVHSRCFTRDITDRKKAEEALREADKRKDVFLAILAHELRNPLAPIRHSLQFLRQTRDSDPTAESVCAMMERQVDHMVRLVDDLMEISRINRGQIELREESVELTTALRSAIETSRPMIEANGHQLRTGFPREPLLVWGDPVRLDQIFANLLNNAAKYTEPGGQIWLTAQRVNGQATVSVRDNGVGIPVDMLGHVFDLFTQVAPTGRSKGGLGIGLTLVRSLVEMHGGTIEARSAGPGRGSEFLVHLPLAGPSHTERTSALEALPAVLSSHRVLVVDDNRDAAESLGMLLRLRGADVHVVYDGLAALEAIAARRPTVVLLDIGMPDPDGYEVARRIRLQPDLRDLTLIALTGWGQAEDRRRAYATGFDHHLTKPVDVSALEALLLAGAI